MTAKHLMGVDGILRQDYFSRDNIHPLAKIAVIFCLVKKISQLEVRLSTCATTGHVFCTHLSQYTICFMCEVDVS